MHILDAIRYDGSTKEKAKKLCKDYDYDPTNIGTAILRACGYDVKVHFEGDISVKDKQGKILFFQNIPYYDLY